MLDQDQPETTTGAGTGDTPDTSAAAPPAPPVVTRRTRKAPAKKAAAAESTPADAPPAEAPPAEAQAAEEQAPRAAARKAPAKKAAAKRTPAKKAAVADAPAPDATEAAENSPADAPVESTEPAAPAKKTAGRRAPAKKAPARKSAAKKAAPALEETAQETEQEAAGESPTDGSTGHAVLFQAPVATTTRRRRKRAEPVVEDESDEAPAEEVAAEELPDEEASTEEAPVEKPARKTAAKKSSSRKPRATEPATPSEEDEAAPAEQASTPDQDDEDESSDSSGQDEESADGEGGPARRRRRRGGRRRRKSSDGSDGSEGQDDSESRDAQDADNGSADDASADATGSTDDDAASGDGGDGTSEGSSRRRRRRRRAGEDGGGDDSDANTVTRVRKTRSAEDQITAVAGSTRLEAKKQRRREGREAGRRRAPIVSEAEFLARRESVERVMVIRQRKDLTQIGVLEDKVLVEHYVARESQTSLIGNVYLGRVQNVLPSMEAAFIDIGKGRNAVLYAGEVNWSSLGHKEGQPRKIESVLSSGQMILVQVTKDPIGHKGARLTSQISLAGRFLVYVPDGTTSGISRKLPDTERNRLKTLLKEIVPDTAGVIVRTAAEGASEDELTHDVERLKSRWEDIEKKSSNKGSGPQMLYGEPDLTLKVVRDLFTEDFSKLVIEGDDAWDTVFGYVESVAPDLADRVQRFERGASGGDIFATYRVDEQIKKGLDRKVWLPSGGSLIIDRTEAMTVVDVNTGKFTGSGGNLEETVTKNNLEAAEEIVRQLRLRDIGGIIVVDFIDMVLESNRDLVVRRLVECLGRDRTRHQVAEVTSLGLVQMTRKRIGTGLVEAFSENCEHCQGRGVVIKDQPVDPDAGPDDGEGRRTGRRRGRRGTNGETDGSERPADQTSGSGSHGNGGGNAPSPKDVAAMARHEKAAEQAVEMAAELEAEAEEGDEQVDEKVDEQIETPAQTAVEPEPQVPTEDAAEPEPEAPVEMQPEAPAADEKPRVITRTRRRSASRPAGPPVLPATATVGVAGTLPESGLVEPGTADVETGAEEAADAASVEHVPVKKKGSRKR